jgi:2-methylcitrate dehydratase PrpD
MISDVHIVHPVHSVHTVHRLADFIRTFQADNLPPSTIDAAKRCLLDLFSAAVAGYDAVSTTALRNLSRKQNSPGKAAIWFEGTKTGGLCAAGAALVNSGAASALDLDDGHRAAAGHPGAGVIPAALAAAQETGTNGPEIVTAIVLGYEIGVRISAARDLARQDTLATGRWNAYGAVAAAGRLRRTPPDRLAQALSVAGVLSPGLSAAGYSRVMGNSAKEGIPWAAYTAMMALDLAEEDFTGPLDILDHPDYYDAAKIADGLGDRFAIESVYFKPYGCCRWIHAALDALLEIQAANGIPGDRIEKIRVDTFGRALKLDNHIEPDSPESAQYSIPFCLALAALEGGGALLPFRPASLTDRRVIDLAGKVALRVNPELDRVFPAAAPARVTVTTAGSEFKTERRHPLGDPANPMDEAALRAKFRRLTEDRLTSEDQEALIGAIASLETNGPENLFTALNRPLLETRP